MALCMLSRLLARADMCWAVRGVGCFIEKATRTHAMQRRSRRSWHEGPAGLAGDTAAPAESSVAGAVGSGGHLMWAGPAISINNAFSFHQCTSVYVMGKLLSPCWPCLLLGWPWYEHNELLRSLVAPPDGTRRFPGPGFDFLFKCNKWRVNGRGSGSIFFRCLGSISIRLVVYIIRCICWSKSEIQILPILSILMDFGFHKGVTRQGQTVCSIAEL
jgi:hypothetical protein